MTKYPNREALRKAHDIYRDAMRSFIIRCLRKVRGEQVEDLIRDSLSYEETEHNGNIEAAIDIKHFPHIIRKYWHRDRGFSQQFNSNSKVQYKTGVIADGRNLWAHPGVEDLDAERTRADLTYVAEVLGEIKNQEAKREVEDIRDRLFSHEEEEHTADVSDQLEVVRAENTELKKQLQITSSRLEEVETEWIASEERLTDMSNLLKSVEAENADLKKRLLEKENRLQTVESERNERIETLSEQLIDNPTKLEAKEGTLSTLLDQLKKAKVEKAKKPSTQKVSEPKLSIAEKFRAANTLKDRVEIGRKVAELRINAQGSRPMSWCRIREKLGLKNDEFHKVIRLEDHFQESVVERIESFEGGWQYSGKLNVLLGFEPVGELANRIEACKRVPRVEPKEDAKSYEYEGESLNTPIIRSILNTSYPWQGSLPISAILEVLTQYHLERGGNPTQLRDFRTNTYDILCEMEAKGRAERYREGNKDYWCLI